MQPTSIAPGDTATVTIQDRQEPCYPDEPSHHETLLARAAGSDAGFTPVAEGDTDAHGYASFTVSPTVSTEYTYAAVPMYKGQYVRTATLTVNRYSGSCAGVLTLTAPAKVPTGGLVQANGTAPDTATVSILFRKRGQTTFQVRRTLTPAADGTFSTTFAADDDYRLYASGQRCDSQPLLVQAQPVIFGPASAPRGSSVTLLVRAPAGVPVKVYFHRAGTSGYEARRSGTVNASGRYVTTYIADADYRYYALTGPGVRTSNNGLTQVH